MDTLRLGKTDMKVSRLGFGGIPIQGVSENEAVTVVRKCLELGINYLDTANGYTTSEARIGKAISGMDRKFHIASKSFARGYDDIKVHLQQTLKNLGVPYLDLYQFHNVSDQNNLDTILGPKGAMAAVLEAKQKGQVRHIGVTSHNVAIAKKAIETGKFDTLMFPFNYIINEAATELLPLVKKHDMGFIAIKALGGGRIKDVKIAFKYLFQFPDILVLPGIARVAEIEEIIQVLKNPRLTASEKSEMQQLREKYSPTYCRHCDLCMPCPQNINISMVLDYEGLTNALTPAALYADRFIEMFEKASNCDDCAECLKKCTYQVRVSELVKDYSRKYLAGQNKYQKA